MESVRDTHTKVPVSLCGTTMVEVSVLNHSSNGNDLMRKCFCAGDDNFKGEESKPAAEPATAKVSAC